MVVFAKTRIVLTAELDDHSVGAVVLPSLTVQIRDALVAEGRCEVVLIRQDEKRPSGDAQAQDHDKFAGERIIHITEGGHASVRYLNRHHHHHHDVDATNAGLDRLAATAAMREGGAANNATTATTANAELDSWFGGGGVGFASMLEDAVVRDDAAVLMANSKQQATTMDKANLNDDEDGGGVVGASPGGGGGASKKGQATTETGGMGNSNAPGTNTAAAAATNAESAGTAFEAPATATEEAPPAKKKPGRPRKNASSSPSSAKKVTKGNKQGSNKKETTPTKKKRGRPPKDTGGKKRGRAPSKKEEESPEEEEESPPPTKKRRGRPPKKDGRANNGGSADDDTKPPPTPAAATADEDATTAQRAADSAAADAKGGAAEMSLSPRENGQEVSGQQREDDDGGGDNNDKKDPESGKKHRIAWEARFVELTEFHAQHGHFEVPNGPLASWVDIQRRAQKMGTLKEERKERLETLGLPWEGVDKFELNWDKCLEELKAFKEIHGHCKVTTKLNKSLSGWLNRQRHLKRSKTLRQDRVDRLNEIGIQWNVQGYEFLEEGEGAEDDLSRRDALWNKRFLQFKQFKKDHGHYNVPQSNKDGLPEWVIRQRKAYENGTLKRNRRDLLNAIDFDFNDPSTYNDRKFDTRYEELRIYFERHGHISVPRSFPGGLSEWIKTQRRAWRKGVMKPDRVERLNALGFEWITTKASIFDERLEQLLEYQVEHGHQKVPKSYPGGLGDWVAYQRKAKKKGILNKDREKQLEEIGFQW